MDIEKTLNNLRREGFEARFFETGAEAADYLAGEFSGTSVGFGGSKTAEALGLYDRLAANNEVHWMWRSPEDPAGAIAAANASKVYITSVNAMAETGELVNIDGRGNRVAATLFGPERMVFVAGVNKLEPDLTRAIWRARNIAAPLNARRLNKKTPCALSAEMKCYDCDSPDRICRGLVVHMRPMMGTTAEVILINEDLGY